MVIRTYFDRNNTIIYNNNTNVGRNPIAELYYGGASGAQSYTRLLFQFDEVKLQGLYNDKTYADLTKLTHTLRMTNTGAFDKELLGKENCAGKSRACSFDLIVFPITQDWDEGNGYDYGACNYVGEASQSICPSNWIQNQTATNWVEPGVYSGSPTVIATQHFEQGNENIEIDITAVVNAYITGGTNNGLGVAFTRVLEETETTKHQYVGFFTRHTQTFYEPFVETVYDCTINDDRSDFYLDKTNKLYLYSNLGGTPTNLDSLPGVIVKDGNGDVFSAITSSAVTQVTKGVYCIEINVPTTADNTDCIGFTDTWTGITVNGVTRPDIELDFILKDSNKYYNIGDDYAQPKNVGLTVTGIKLDERIYRGDVRKVIVSTRIPYTINQKQSVDSLKYRLYVKEGRNEFTVIDFQDVNMANNSNYFLLDTESLVPGTYYLDMKVESNLEVTTSKEVISFDIVSQSNSRISQ
jgi:hypothetical protein